MPDYQFILDNLYNTPREKFDNSQLNPIIGAPNQAPEDPIVPINTDKIIETATKAPSPYTVTQRPYGEYVSDRYPYIIPGHEMEDIYGRGQSSLSKAFNGVTKGLGLTATTLVQTTAGLVNGLFKWAQDGKFSSFYDNELNNSLDEFNNYLENEFPNYYSNVEANAEWYTPSNLLTANFLFDKLVKNTGFAAGAALSGGAFAYGLRSLGVAARATALGKGVEALAATEQALALGEAAPGMYSRLAALTTRAGGVNNLINKGYRATVAGLATTGEAGFEALQATNEFRNSLINDYIATHDGQHPGGMDLQEINELAEQSGNLVFKLNLGLLSASNYIQFPKILGASYKAEKGILNNIKRENLQDYAATLPQRGFKKRITEAKNIAGLLFSGTEAAEEGAQFIASTGVQNYFDKKYREDGASILTDLLGYGTEQLFSQKEGMESLLLGGLTGGLVGGVTGKQSKLKERGLTGYGGQRAINTQKLVSDLNESKFSSFMKDTTDSVDRGVTLQLQREAAIRRGDILESKELESDQMFNYLSARIKHDRYDLVKDEIDEYQQLAQSEEGFAQLKEAGIANNTDTKETFLSRLENIKLHADNIKRFYDILNLKYTGVVNTEGERVFAPEVIDKMVYASAKIADYNIRIPQLQTALFTNGVMTQPIIDSINLNGNPSTDSVTDAVNYINNLNITSEEKDTLKQELQDLIELSLRKQDFIKEFDRIRSNPGKYTEPDPTAPIKLKDTEGNEVDLEVGKEYFTDLPFINIDGKVYPAPRIGVLGRNIANEVQVVLPDGKTKFIPVKELAALNLTTKSPDLANFSGAIDRVLKANNIDAPTSIEDKAALINTPELLAQVEEQLELDKKEQEVLNKRKQFLEDLIKKLNPPETHESTGEVTIDFMWDPIKRKPINVLFNTTTYNRTFTKDYIKRQQYFFNSLDKTINLPKERRSNLKMLLVTANNEAYLGLTGLTEYLLKGTTIDAVNVKQGPIVTVLAEQDGTDIYYLDEQGNRVGKIKEQTDFNKLVFATLPTDDLTWRDSEFAGEERYSQATVKEALEYSKEWAKKREDIFNWTDNTEVFNFTITPGFPELNDVRDDGSRSKTPIGQALVSNSELRTKQGLIAISDGLVRFQDQNYNIPAGRPYLKTDFTLQPLTNRRLTEQEQETAFNLLKELSKKPKLDQRILNFLNGFIYFSRKEENKRILQSQIALDKNGFLHFSDKFSIPFTEISLENNKDRILAHLTTVYNNINSKLLKDSGRFEEIIAVDPEGALETRLWPNYQTYLTSDKYDLAPEEIHTSKGKQRNIDLIPLTTDVRALSKDVPLDTNFYYKFARLTNNYDGQPLIRIEKKASTKEDTKVELPKNIEKIVTASDTATYKNNVISYTYTHNRESGEIDIQFENNDSLKNAIANVPEDMIEGVKQDFPDLSDEAAAITYIRTMVSAKIQRQNIQSVPVSEQQEQKIEQKVEETVKGEKIGVYDRSPKFDLRVGDYIGDAEVLEIKLISTGPRKGEIGTIKIKQEDKTFFVDSTKISGNVFRKQPTSTEAKQISPATTPKKPKIRKGGSRFRVVKEHYKTIIQNLEEEAVRVNQILPQIPIYRLRNLIKTTGGFAYGQFKNAAIYVYENAETGTMYHEAFEAVWAMFTDYKERANILKEFRNREGAFIDRETGNSLDYSSADDHQIKEQLAEEFREFLLTEKLPERKGNVILNFFKDLLNFIKSLFTGQAQTINQLFNRIGSGYYATQAPKPSNIEPQYRKVTIGNLSVSDSYKIVRGITATLFQKFFAENRSLVDLDISSRPVEDLYNDVFEELRSFYEEEVPEYYKDSPDELESYLYLWEELKNNWQQAESLTKEFLKTFGIKETKVLVEDEKTQDEEGEESNYEGSKNSDSYVVDVFAMDAKKSASASIRVLFNTITKSIVEEDGNIYDDIDPRTLMPQLLDDSKLFNRVLSELSGLSTPLQMWDRLKELTKVDASFVKLYNRLRLDMPVSELTDDDWSLRTKFFNVFSKQSPEGLVNFITGTDKSVVVSTNLNTVADDLIDSWLSSWKITNNPIVKINANGEYVINSERLKKYNARDLDSQLRFLNDLEIDFTEEDFNNLDKDAKETFSKSVYNLIKYLAAGNNKQLDSAKDLDTRGTFVNLAKLILTANNDTYSSTYFDINGNRRQQFIQKNTISEWLDDINTSTSIEELYEKLPHLQNIYSQDSAIVKELFTEDGKRTEKKLTIKYIQGKVQNNNVTPLERLTLSDRVVTELSNNLNGDYYVLVPADSKTEWIINLGNQYSYKDFDNNLTWSRLYNQINSYYQTERAVGGDGLLKDVVGNYDKETLDNQEIKSFIEGKTAELKNFLEENKLIQKVTVKDKRTNEETIYYKIKDLNSDFLKDNGLQRMSMDDIDRLISFLTINYIVNEIEIHKLFFGPVSAIKDPLKRYKSFMSPRESSYYGDTDFNNAMTNKYNEGIDEGDLFYYQFKEYVPTITLQDVKTYTSKLVEDENLPKETKGAYEQSESTDAQSWATGLAYREILIRSGRLTKAQDRLINYLLASDRLLMEEDGFYTYKSKSLKEKDQALVAKGIPKNVSLQILKPIGSGYTTDNNLFLDKTSLAPMFYTWARGRNISKLYAKMLKERIGYAIVKSGRKIGAGVENTIYDKEGKFNEQPYEGVINIPFKYYGIQVETSKTTNKNTLGTQMSKDIFLNLFNAGIPIDFQEDEKDFNKRESAWNSITDEQEKENASDIYKLVRRNIETLEEMQNLGYEKLLDKFSIIDTGNGFIIDDKQKLLDVITSELFKREAPDNVKNAFALDEQSNFVIPIEATSYYEQVKNILFSYVDKLISRPKLSGGAKIQMSGAMWETGDRTVKVGTINGKEALVSEELAFYSADYTEEGKVTKVNKMEVLIPNWFLKDLRKRGITRSNKEIIDYLKEGQEILTGIGFRIPTQEINSLDVFIVKDFLPEGMGDAIVVPEALTTKAGSDFDVDKLNTYLKNVWIDAKGNPRLIRFFDIDTNNEKALKDFYEDNLLEKFKKQKKKEQQVQREAAAENFFNAFLEANDFTDEEQLFEDEPTEKTFTYIPTLEEFIIENKGISKYELNKKYNRFNYRKVLENDYYNSLEQLTLLPHNFARLVKPNSNEQLKGIYRDLVALAPQEFESTKDKSLLNRVYMNFMRHAFIAGKGGVGIAAVRQTNNALAQLGRIYIDFNRSNALDQSLRPFIRENAEVLLKHNTITIAGKQYPTFSISEDIAGNRTSEIISQFIDAYVDIAKDPFIIQIGATQDLASTFLTMAGMGIDIKTVVMFMNQPIIREYMKWLSLNGTTYLFNDGNIQAFKKEKGFFKTVKPGTKLSIKENNLSDNISKYYTGKNEINRSRNLTNDELIEQNTILAQFLQFAVMAQNMRTMVQGTTYDTDISADPNLNHRKETFTERALNNTLFVGVESIFDNSFIGNQRRLSSLSSEALSESIFVIGRPEVRQYITPILDRLIEKGAMTKDAYIRYARKAEQSLITYLIQTNRGLNTRMKELLVDLETSVALQVKKLQEDIPADSDLAENVILKRLYTYTKGNKKQIKNVALIGKVTDAYNSDIFTYSFADLKNNPTTEKLYGDLIRLSFLQSGIAKSKISYFEYFPMEDYAKVVKPIVDNIYNYDNIGNYTELDAFFRNNWNNPEIVAELEEDFNFTSGVDVSKHHVTHKWFTDLKLENDIKQGIYAPIKVSVKNRASKSHMINYTKYGSFDAKFEGNSFKLLMKRLEDEQGNPKIHTELKGGYENDYYIYYPVNAWGDSFRAEEHYDTPRESVISNGFIKIANELSTNQILEAYNNRNIEKNVVPLQEPVQQVMQQEVEPTSNIIESSIINSANELDKDIENAKVQAINEYLAKNQNEYNYIKVPLDTSIDRLNEIAEIIFEDEEMNFSKEYTSKYLKYINTYEDFLDAKLLTESIEKYYYIVDKSGDSSINEIINRAETNATNIIAGNITLEGISFKQLLEDVQKGFTEEDKQFEEQAINVLNKYGLGKYIKGYNPNQLSLFDQEQVNNNKNKLGFEEGPCK